MGEWDEQGEGEESRRASPTVKPVEAALRLA
jgi:hypothetical protein